MIGYTQVIRMRWYSLAEMNEKELLSAVLYEVKAIRAKVDFTADDLHHFRNEVNEFKNEMMQFRNETNNNFNKLGRRVGFIETDYNQLNQRVDKLELSGNF